MMPAAPYEIKQDPRAGWRIVQNGLPILGPFLSAEQAHDALAQFCATRNPARPDNVESEGVV